MQQEEPKSGGLLTPMVAVDKLLPFEADAVSSRLGWTSLDALRFHSAPAFECHTPGLTHHRFILFDRRPEELEMVYEGVERRVPPPAGSTMLVPADCPSICRWSESFSMLIVFLEAKLVERVAAESFDLDPARLTIPSLDCPHLPSLPPLMEAVEAEMTAGGAGGPLAAESLANVLAVQLIRHILAPRQVERGRDGPLPRERLRAVVEFIEEHLNAGPTLEQMAAVARLSPYHFARQFKTATGLPPHQYVITRRVERAKQLLQGDGNLSLAEIAANAGFADPSHFSRHFKRLVGITPRQFRPPASIES